MTSKQNYPLIVFQPKETEEIKPSGFHKGDTLSLFEIFSLEERLQNEYFFQLPEGRMTKIKDISMYILDLRHNIWPKNNNGNRVVHLPPPSCRRVFEFPIFVPQVVIHPQCFQCKEWHEGGWQCHSWNLQSYKKTRETPSHLHFSLSFN